MGELFVKTKSESIVAMQKAKEKLIEKMQAFNYEKQL